MDYHEDRSINPHIYKTNQLPGPRKGHVVDVRDPFLLGRTRVHVYADHGDYKDMDIRSLPWAAGQFGVPGAFTPPHICTKTWVEYEHAHRGKSTYGGVWTSIPMNRGTLPFDSSVGIDIRPEALHHHDLYPESMVLGSTGDGNTISMRDRLFLSGDKGKGLESQLRWEDSGGKYFQAWSFHKESEGYASLQKFEEAKEGGKGRICITNEKKDPHKPQRDGFTPVEKTAPGAVELGDKNLHQRLISGEGTFSQSSLVQHDKDGAVGAEQHLLNGDMFSMRQGQSSLAMMEDVMFLGTADGVMAPKLYQVPDRWDT